MTNKKLRIIGELSLLLVAMIWGSSFVVLKDTLNSISTLWMLAIRFMLSAIIMAAFAGKRLLRLSRESLKGGILLGISLVLAYLFQTYGLLFTTPGKNAFLTATYCVLTPFLVWAIYKKKPGKSSIPAALLCLVGIGFVSLNGGEGEAAFNIGDALTLGCGLFFAWQIVLLEKHREDVDAFSLNAMQFGVSGLVFLLLALIIEPFPREIPVSAMWGMAYIVLAVTAFCFFVQAWALKYVESSAGSLIMCLESVFGALCSMLFYHERMTALLLVGFALIFAAVVISEMGEREH